MEPSVHLNQIQMIFMTNLPEVQVDMTAMQLLDCIEVLTTANVLNQIHLYLKMVSQLATLSLYDHTCHG